MYRELTVADVHGLEEEDNVEIRFLESARIYVLPRSRADFDQLLARLREGKRVRVAFTPPDGDVIEDVRDP